MAWDHALKMQTSHNIYLFMARFSVKYTIYRVELETIKKSAGKGVLLSQWQNIAEATPPVRNKKEEQEASHFFPVWIVSYSTFSRYKNCCALSVKSTSSVQAEGTILWLERSHFVIMFYHLHNNYVRPWIPPLTNEHIYKAGQGCPADTVHYFNIYVMKLSCI